MGFGWLLIGYFTATMMSLNTLGGVFSLLGYAIAIFGAKKLSAYEKSFSLLCWGGLFMTLVSAFAAFSDVNRLLYDFMLVDRVFIGTWLDNLIDYIRYGGEFAFTVMLCYSVKAIAKETGEIKTVYLAIRNLVISCLYYFSMALGWIPSEAIAAFAKKIYLPVWVMVLCVIVTLLNSLMLFSCYARICDENDVDMPEKPKKPSRFAFVNEMRAEKDKKRMEKEAREAKKQESRYSDVQQRRSAANAKKKKKNK